MDNTLAVIAALLGTLALVLLTLPDMVTLDWGAVSLTAWGSVLYIPSRGYRSFSGNLVSRHRNPGRQSGDDLHVYGYPCGDGNCRSLYRRGAKSYANLWRGSHLVWRCVGELLIVSAPRVLPKEMFSGIITPTKMTRIMKEKQSGVGRPDPPGILLCALLDDF